MKGIILLALALPFFLLGLVAGLVRFGFMSGVELFDSIMDL